MIEMFNYCMFTFSHLVNKNFKFKCFTNLLIFFKDSITDNTIGATFVIRVLSYSKKKKLSIVKDSNGG